MPLYQPKSPWRRNCRNAFWALPAIKAWLVAFLTSSPMPSFLCCCRNCPLLLVAMTSCVGRLPHRAHLLQNLVNAAMSVWWGRCSAGRITLEVWLLRAKWGSASSFLAVRFYYSSLGCLGKVAMISFSWNTENKDLYFHSWTLAFRWKHQLPFKGSSPGLLLIGC